MTRKKAVFVRASVSPPSLPPPLPDFLRRPARHQDSLKLLIPYLGETTVTYLERRLILFFTGSNCWRRLLVDSTNLYPVEGQYGFRFQTSCGTRMYCTHCATDASQPLPPSCSSNAIYRWQSTYPTYTVCKETVDLRALRQMHDPLHITYMYAACGIPDCN